jgi:hypothetical protein
MTDLKVANFIMLHSPAVVKKAATKTISLKVTPSFFQPRN